MKTIYLLLVLVAAVHGSIKHSTATKGYINSRIVGGRNALENEFPYVVSISWIWDGETVSSHGCGGSILNANWILSAAHCLNWQGGEYLVRAGALHLDRVMEGEQTSKVRSIFIHPDFDTQAVVSASDIGLLELETALVYTKSVRPISLPIVDQLPVISNARISGWGSISNNQTVVMPNTLQTILLPVISNAECQAIIEWSGSTIYPHDMCTGTGSGGIGTCGGDSGGALTQHLAISLQNVIVGVVQWGFTPCSLSPTVYARVSHFVPWIKSIMNE